MSIVEKGTFLLLPQKIILIISLYAEKDETSNRVMNNKPGNVFQEPVTNKQFLVVTAGNKSVTVLSIHA